MVVSDDWQLSKRTVKDRFGFLFNNELFSDVHFVVGKDVDQKRIPAHKLVLSAGSPVLCAMFNGPLAHHSDDDIQLSDIEEDALLALLKYLYSDDFDIRTTTVMHVLYASKKYMVPALENACVDFMKKKLNPSNALVFLRQATLFDEHELAAQCLEIIDRNAPMVLNSKDFLHIELETLCQIIQRDTVHAREVQIFDAVVRWSEEECIRKQVHVDGKNKRMVLGHALSLIRFPLMTSEQFARGPANSGVLLDHESVSVFQYLSIRQSINLEFSTSFRGLMKSVCRFESVKKLDPANLDNELSPPYKYELEFCVDRPIRIVGFGVFKGQLDDPKDYQIKVKVIEKEEENEDVKLIFFSDGTNNICDRNSTMLLVQVPAIKIAPNKTYIVSTISNRKHAYMGSKAISTKTVSCPICDKVTFTFKKNNDNNHRQIPEILFTFVPS